MYTTETYQEPFWAENSGFMTGRDPLGMQNSSIATYGRLLPGMTNLTSRLRYYGFYLWLLNEYHKKAKKSLEGNLVYHYNFIRRAELILAYLMVNKFPSEKGVVGSDFAKNHQDDVKKLGYYDIGKGADKLKKTVKYSVYWDFKSGALGQYYVGSLVNLNLLEVSNQFFIITEKGEKLASAFQNSIPSATRQLFLEVIENGELTSKQLNSLVKFSINDIPPNSEEYEFYKELLIDNDGIKFKKEDGNLTSLRKETIQQYLLFIKKQPGTSPNSGFTEYQYKLNQEKIGEDSSFGWYYYYVNEAFHFSLETIFWAMLVELDGKIFALETFIEDIKTIIINQSIGGFIKNENDKISAILKSLEKSDLFKELKCLKGQTKSSNSSKEAIAQAIKTLFIIYSANKLNFEAISRFEKSNYLSNQQGRISKTVDIYIEKHFEKSFSHYIDTIIKKIINVHINTAYRKMRNGESNLLKFIIEDNNITHIQTMQPKNTSPRLNTLQSYLLDLKFINSQNELTALGTNLLKAIRN